MADRTVNVRLTLDASSYQRTAQASADSTLDIAAAARTAAATVAESSTQAGLALGRLDAEAGAIPATFRAAGAQAAGALSQVSGAALESSQALARTAAAAAETGTEAASALSRVTAAATGATGATDRLAGSAAGLPGTFLSAQAAADRMLGQVTAGATTSSAALTEVGARAAAQASTQIAGISQIGLASRLAIAEALTAQNAALAASAASTEAAEAGMFGRITAAARAMRASVVTTARSTSSALLATATAGDKAASALKTGSLVLLGIAGAAAVVTASFEKSMSAVGAVANANGQELQKLRTAALDAGRDTAYTASQAADAEAELARAGVSVADITGGALKGSLSLAAAGQLDLADAATVSAQAMNTFGLHGKDVSHIADVLAAGANKSASDVKGLGDSLRQGGLLAAQTGMSFEDTIAVLSAFADHALIGSDAGTSLKTMLQRLTPQSTQAANEMQALGFSAYDANGQFVGLSALAGRMQSSFGNLTPAARNAAMSVIFGSDAVRSASILYQLGAQGINQYISAVDDQGAASRVAAQQMNNLSGDLQYLKGSLEVALIDTGSAANGVLRDMVQGVNSLVNAYSALPHWAQVVVLGITGIGGAAGLAASAFVLAIPKIAAFKTSLDEVALTMPRVAAAASATTSFLTGPWGIGLAVAGAALMAFGLMSSDTKKSVQSLTDAVKQDSGAIGDNVKALVAQQLEASGALDTAKKYGLSLSLVEQAALGSTTALDQVNQKLAENATKTTTTGKAQLETQGSTTQLKEDAAKLRDTLTDTNSTLGKAVTAYKDQAEASGQASTATDQLGASAKQTADDMSQQTDAAKQLSDALDALDGTNIGVASSAIKYQESLAGLRQAVKDDGKSFDITTDKGRQLKSAFLDAAQAALDHAEAVAKQQDSVSAGDAVLAQDIDQLKKTMQQAGLTKDQIESLTQAYSQIPPQAVTQVTDPGALQTMRDLQDLQAKLANVPTGHSITISAPTEEVMQALQAIGLQVESLPQGKVKVTIPTNDAYNSVAAIQSYLDSLQNKTIYIKSVYTQGYTITGQGPYGGKPQPNANGGVYAYATGGITRAAAGLTDRQPMIADRPILWAEAGPEAYIPLSPDRRARSTALLGDVAGRFGYQLVPISRAAPTVGPAVVDQSREITVNLYGAGQSTAEQAADVARHMQFVS